MHHLDGSNAERAKVAELVDALDLGSSASRRESSSLSFRTTQQYSMHKRLHRNGLALFALLLP